MPLEPGPSPRSLFVVSTLAFNTSVVIIIDFSTPNHYERSTRTSSREDAEADDPVGGDASRSRRVTALVELDDGYAEHEGVDGDKHEPQRGLLPGHHDEPDERQDERGLGHGDGEHREELPDRHQAEGLGEQREVEVDIVITQAISGRVAAQDDKDEEEALVAGSSTRQSS